MDPQEYFKSLNSKTVQIVRARNGLRLKPIPKLSRPARDQLATCRERWEKFLLAMNIDQPKGCPDPNIIRTFFWWYTNNSKGRINERPSLSTVQFQLTRFANMYQRFYKAEISQEIVNEIKEFIDEELELEDAEFPKEYADWEDVKIILRFIILEDNHPYRTKRFPPQLMCFLLLTSDHGERPGAIGSSSSYRDENTALCYEDIKLFLRPVSASGDTEFKVVIKFNNRKGERQKPKEFLEQTYLQRPDLAHCFVLWFLVIAFLDDSIEDIATPRELFSLKNRSESDIPIAFKTKLMSVPIFRRTDSNGLSPTFAWDTGSITNILQRIFKDAGFFERFTLYAIRRAVHNGLADSAVSVSRRKQVMGHKGKEDTTYKRYYESRKFTVDVGNIYRGEEQRHDRTKVLNMRMSRVSHAGRVEVSQELQDKTEMEDETFQRLKERQNFLKDVASKDKDDPRRAELKKIRGDLRNRRRLLERVTKKNLQDDMVKNRGKEFIRSQLRSQAPEDPLGASCRDDVAHRLHLAEVLYPAAETPSSPLLAIERLLAHCSDDHSKSPPWSREESALLLDLAQDSSLTWVDIAKSFVDRTPVSVRKRHGLLAAADASIDVCFRKPPWSREELALLSDLAQDSSLSWVDIAKSFAGRTPASVRRRLIRLTASSKADTQVGNDKASTPSKSKADTQVGNGRKRLGRLEASSKKAGTQVGNDKASTSNKSKTKFPWTVEQLGLLEELVEDSSLSWVDVGKYFTDQTSQDVQLRYKQLMGNSKRKRPLDEEMSSSKRSFKDWHLSSDEDSSEYGAMQSPIVISSDEEESSERSWSEIPPDGVLSEARLRELSAECPAIIIAEEKVNPTTGKVDWVYII